MSYRLGVDVGGRFTDVLLVYEDTGQTWRGKTHSSPDDQSVGVLRGTTVTTNVVLEQRGARVGLVTNEGYCQVLQIAHSYVIGGLVTVDGARRYGVVLDGRGEVDETGTEELRAQKAEEPTGELPIVDKDPDLQTIMANALAETGLPAPVPASRP